MLRILFILIVLIVSVHVHAQKKLIIKYSDSTYKDVAVSNMKVFVKDSNHKIYKGTMRLIDNQHMVINEKDTLSLGSIIKITKKANKAGGDFLLVYGTISLGIGAALLTSGNSDDSVFFYFLQQMMGVAALAQGILFDFISIHLLSRGRVKHGKHLEIICQ